MPADPNADLSSGPAHVMLTAEGPLLVRGPVRVELPDGRQVSSDRPVTALCGCRRSRRYPFCDASHRISPRADREARANREELADREEPR